jgi:DNA-binding NarL/FixJ family response regulator
VARVLIVEDEYIFALGLETMLQSLGFSPCAVARSAAQAVSFTRARRPDIVIMDVNLAGEVDGIAAAREIAAEHRCPLIFLTAYTDEATVNRMLSVSPAAIIRKPGTPEALVSAIHKALPRA